MTTPTTTIAELRATDVAAGARQCTGCGCTDNHACEPPCWWVAPDYCSSCHRNDIEGIYATERAAIDARLDPKLWCLDQSGIDGQRWIGGQLTVIWSVGRYGDGNIWLHVSVSRATTLPTYSDMTRIKALFVGPDRCAYTVLPAAANHVNLHPNCLHLWAPIDQAQLPLPDFTRGTGSI